jgi:hypothetical protein
MQPIDNSLPAQTWPPQVASRIDVMARNESVVALSGRDSPFDANHDCQDGCGNSLIGLGGSPGLFFAQNGGGAAAQRISELYT